MTVQTAYWRPAFQDGIRHSVPTYQLVPEDIVVWKRTPWRVTAIRALPFADWPTAYLDGWLAAGVLGLCAADVPLDQSTEPQARQGSRIMTEPNTALMLTGYERSIQEAPVMPDPRGPEHQRVVTDWHIVSATSHKSWSPDGEEWDLEYDIEHPDECDLLPYSQECLFDHVATLFGLDEGELGFGPREARAHVYGPDMNGDFEEWIEWGKDAKTAPQPAQSEGASDA